MPFHNYSAGRFTAQVCSRLHLWYESFSQDPMRRMVRRNLDRECDRRDVKEDVWVEFLHQIAHDILPEDAVQWQAYERWISRGRPFGSPEEDWYGAEQDLRDRMVLDPLKIIDDVLEGNRTLFALPGRGIPAAASDPLHRYMPLADFARHNLQSLPLPKEVHTIGADYSGYAKLATWINAGLINGSWLSGSVLGRPDYPVWCTDRSLLPTCGNATEIRNTLGLKHIDNGFLAEIAYSIDSLRRRSEMVRAPTFLDACANGAGNWIFTKNRRASDNPGWGYTGRLTARRVLEEGAPEAVHKHFKIDDIDASNIHIRALGPIGGSPPEVDYQLTIQNPDV